MLNPSEAKTRLSKKNSSKKTTKKPSSLKKAESPTSRIRWTQITGLTLKNFKRFENLSNLKLAPLTILTGPNSSGKSTIIQSLVLLKQSLEIPTALDALAFNDLVQLGSGLRVLRSNTNLDKFSIGLEIDLSDVAESAAKDLGIKLERVIVEWWFKPTNVGTTTDMIRFFGVDDGGKEHPLASIRKDTHNKNNAGRATHRLHVEHESLRQSLNNLSRTMFQADLEPLPPVMLKRFLPQFMEIRRDTTLTMVPLVGCDPLFAYILPLLERSLSSQLHYIGPLRVEPSEMYAQNSRRIGVRGEDSIAFLRANAEKRISRALPNGKSATLLDAVNAWLVYMEAGDDLEFTPLGDRFFEAKTGEHRLNEVGCGLGQVLPVLIQCLAAAPRSIVLLEQPEIHLHQKLQASLADFLLQMSQRGVRIIAETHSELMIMRIRRRIAESQRGELMNSVAVYFTTHDGLEKIPIDDRGNVKIWPPSFFDQGLHEMRALAQAQLRRT